MIFDAIVDAVMNLIELLIEGAVQIIEPAINAMVALVEWVVGLFFSGYSMRRLDRKKRPRVGKKEVSPLAGTITLLITILIVGGLLFVPKLLNREHTFVAGDGHAVRYAALVVREDGEDRHVRTDRSGTIELSRFGTDSVTIKDPRYVEQTWAFEGLERNVTVKRTVVGSALDSFADRLLKAVEK